MGTNQRQWTLGIKQQTLSHELSSTPKSSLKGKGFVECFNAVPFPRRLTARLEAILSAA